MRNQLLLAALVSLALLTGCANPQVRYVYVEPQCTVPPLPAFNPPNWEDLLLPESVLQGTQLQRFSKAIDYLERYEAVLVDTLHEHREMLKVLCSRADK